MAMTEAKEAALVRALFGAFIPAFVVVAGDAAGKAAFAKTLSIESIQAIRLAGAEVEPETFARYLVQRVSPSDILSTRAIYINQAITVGDAAETAVQEAFTTLSIAEEPPVLLSEEEGIKDTVEAVQLFAKDAQKAAFNANASAEWAHKIAMNLKSVLQVVQPDAGDPSKS